MKTEKLVKSIVDVLEKKMAVMEVKGPALDQKAAGMIALDLQLHTIVEDHGFNDFLQEAIPGCHLPSRTAPSWTLVQKLYDDNRKTVQ